MYGNIGCTRRDKTPAHWRDDYKLTQTAKVKLQDAEAERRRLFAEFELLPDDISDEDYIKAERKLTAQLDALIDKKDEIRRING